jgi:acyl phosphate:glycerol-3-phosphate acyltransferase
MPPAVGLVLAYLAGSIPTAYLAGRLVKGIDLRQHGSGNLGATNVYRVLGAKVAVVVFLVDVAKGALPVWLLPGVTSTVNPKLWAIVYGLASVAGHVRPVFLLGKGGGKGVATATGVFLALAPLATSIAFAVWVIVVAASGYVSLGSLIAAVVLPIVVLVRSGVESPVFIVAALLAAFVFWTHRQNIGRLRRGEEHRFGRRRGGTAA